MEPELVQNRKDDFVKVICESQKVYALANDEGYATTVAKEMVQEDGSATDVICFWADEASAKECIANEWKGFKVSEITLTEFVEKWCVGMNAEGLIVGTNFGKNPFEFEAEPLLLILEIADELKLNNQQLTLNEFKDIEEMAVLIRENLENE